jgi:ABC-type Na+ efflux pump permease subunit
MGLTWKDAVSTLTLALIVATYAVYVGGASLWLISSTWATTAVILIFGLICAVCAVGGSYTRPRPRSAQVLSGIAIVVGVIALFAGLTGMVTDSAYALKILVMTTMVVWMIGTCLHVSTIGSD